MKPIIVFYDPSFPYSGERLPLAAFAQLQNEVQIVDAQNLESALSGLDGGCFVNLHAPYFPKQAWPAILGYLQKGGGLVSSGGAPFKVPVRLENNEWVKEPEQTSYHQQINIHETMPVQAAPIDHFIANLDIPVCSEYMDLLTVEPTYSLILHVTHQSDQPHEGGTSGPMDTHIYPLVKGVSKAKREVAAPIVLMEQTKGDFRGSRWMFINQQLTEKFWSNKGVEAILEWAKFCARGVTEMWARPSLACYDPGDKAKLRFQFQHVQRKSCVHSELHNAEWTFDFALTKVGQSEDLIWTDCESVSNSHELQMHHLQIPIDLEAGRYELTVIAMSNLGEKRIIHQGFWCKDVELLQSGEMLSCDRDYFHKDGKPMPIVGMTYMSSDVARKFIFMPNVSVWNKDMATMKNAGINLIRTGIWTSYRHAMYVDGHPSEDVLCAIDAFIMTAKQYDLEVTFTFFAFTPETWEGVNPYLDPRSIEAQKRFIAAVVSRHQHTKNVHWDFINEPSMFDPKRIFEGPRSAQDAFERHAYIDWLKERHASIDELQVRWGFTPAQLPSFEAIQLPEHKDINFDIQDMIFGKKGTQWLDYSLFTMAMLNQWTLTMRETIQAFNPNQLVTIGQDEALYFQRPSPFFYEETVDYTTNHSWWLMDQLVWDGIFAKTPYKPNLIQETGIMYVETPDGKAKRTEEELRNILERKYAYSFSTGGAGAVQWLWNTNFYMDNINESNIGAIRADGTEKPEANVSYDFGAFMGEISPLFQDRKLEDIVVIFPYSNDLSNRRLAVEATSRLTRVLTYEMNVHFRALSEYQLDALKDQPAKLIVVPSAHNFSSEAFDQLITHVADFGATLLVTGPLRMDAYWKQVERLTEQVGASVIGNVLREEAFDLGGKRVPLSYSARKIAKLSKELMLDSETGTASREAASLQEIAIGKGRMLWCGLPIEMNDRTESIEQLYQYAIEQCEIEPELVWEQGGDLAGIYGRKLSFKQGSLYIFVSEYGVDAEIKVADPTTNQQYDFRVESERTVMFAVDLQGKLIAVYRPEEVEISMKPWK
ncbi:beta-galactosidase [Paenibacillus sp. N1-5-1-14]|uniref:beta-galactosidase n=1 Tax=Paenibacillus radicibacter TaxID=2972488 RepID=UPI002158CA46|nr:beta-galactosidase [Paenibacillus radicibacter]MCR8642517.1 beta-galactosidase [Paenibacillus radicibacter]